MGPIFSNSTTFTNWFGGLGNAISDFNNSCLNLPESGSPSLADTANVISCANAVINAAGGFAEVFNISSLSTATNYVGLISNQANVSANIAQTLDAINNYSNGGGDLNAIYLGVIGTKYKIKEIQNKE